MKSGRKCVSRQAHQELRDTREEMRMVIITDARTPDTVPLSAIETDGYFVDDDGDLFRRREELDGVVTCERVEDDLVLAFQADLEVEPVDIEITIRRKL